MSQPMYTTNAPHCPRHGFAPHPGGECVACEREDLERAVVARAKEWAKADAKLSKAREKLSKSKSDEGKAWRAYLAWEKADKSFKAASAALRKAVDELRDGGEKESE